MSQFLERFRRKRELFFLKVKPLHPISSVYQICEINIVHFLRMMKPKVIIYMKMYKLCLKILFICFWLHWVLIAACWLSPIAASGSDSPWGHAGFSLGWLLLLQSTGSRCSGFSCGMQAQYLWLVGSRVWAQ